MPTQYLGLRGKALVHFMLMTVVCPAYILLGYNNAVMGGLLTLPSFLETFSSIDTVSTAGTSAEAENARVQGTVVALYTVGCMMGSLSCYVLGDKLGRIRTIAVGSVLVIIGSVLLASSFSLAQLIVGRLVLGVGFGMLSATVPVWQSESSPAEHRGALVVLEGLFASVGLALSQWVDLGMYFVDDSASWRFPFALPIFFGLVILSVLPFLPDSPRWLVKVGHIEKARHVLAALENVDPDSPVIAQDISKMKHSISETGKGDFRSLLSNGENRLANRTLLAMFSTFSQQINGIGVIGFYTTTIFEELLGLSAVVARVLSGCIYMWQLSNTLVAFYTIDRIGRRKLMMFGNIGMGVMFVIIAGGISQAEHSRACAIVAAVCVFLVATFFGIGALGINYLYGTEVAPLSHRVPIYALTSTTLWSFNFLVVEVTPLGFSNLGYKFFIVFAVINICLLFPGKAQETSMAELHSTDTATVVYFFLPETRRRSLEDMDEVFRQARGPLDVVRVARTTVKPAGMDEAGLSASEKHDVAQMEALR